MNPDYARLSVSDALATCEAITSHVTSPSNPFSLDAKVLASISEAHNDLAAKGEAQRLGVLDQRMKTAAKDRSLQSAGAILSFAAKVPCRPRPPRPSSRGSGSRVPRGSSRSLGATGLVATAQADARVKLAWGRNGNPQGTTFEIFGSADGPDYAMVAACWFQVRANRSGLFSPFSNVASVYAPGTPGRPALRVA